MFGTLALFLLIGTQTGAAPAKPPVTYAYAPYNEGKMDPQAVGWPLTDSERAYALRPEFQRRPESEAGKHLPAMWPVTPSAGYWSGTTWLDTHAALVKEVQANRGPIDILLVGDSLTWWWGGSGGRPYISAWQKRFARLKTVNIGIGGDKTQNVLWRLDHGAVDGLEPRVVVLLIGTNNMYFTPETGADAAARGIQACAANLRSRFPKAPVAVVKVFPAGSPGAPFYEDIKKTNVALDALKLDQDPMIRVLDLWGTFVAMDGKPNKELFAPDGIHLSPAGYELYASRLQPLLDRGLTAAPASKFVP